MHKAGFLLVAAVAGAVAGRFAAKAVAVRRLGSVRQSAPRPEIARQAIERRVRAGKDSGFSRDQDLERGRGLRRAADARLGDEAAGAAVAPVRPIRYGGEAAEANIAADRARSAEGAEPLPKPLSGPRT